MLPLCRKNKKLFGMYSNPSLLSLLPDYLLSPPILTGDLVCNLMKKLEGASWTTANFLSPNLHGDTVFPSSLDLFSESEASYSGWNFSFSVPSALLVALTLPSLQFFLVRIKHFHSSRCPQFPCAIALTLYPLHQTCSNKVSS